MPLVPCEIPHLRFLLFIHIFYPLLFQTPGCLTTFLFGWYFHERCFELNKQLKGEGGKGTARLIFPACVSFIFTKKDSQGVGGKLPRRFFSPRVLTPSAKHITNGGRPSYLSHSSIGTPPFTSARCSYLFLFSPPSRPLPRLSLVLPDPPP